MAATTEARARASLNLKTIGLMLGDLPEVAEEWGELGDGERVSWSIDWSNELAGLEQLAADAAVGALTSDQLACYEVLLARLRQALPTLERLDLYRPAMLLDE